MKESLKDLRIGVLSGGKSAEREISLRTGAAVSGSLKENGYNVLIFDLDDKFAENLKNIDVCFIALHGTYGEDGRVQGALDLFGVPYTGSGVTASALAMDKLKSKAIFEYGGLKTPPHISVRKGEGMNSVEKKLSSIKPPYFVKPNSSGSSIGCGMVSSSGDEFNSALKNALDYDDEILVEQKIYGREIQFAVAFGEPLGCVEVKPGDIFYTYEAKYTRGKTQYIVNPELSQQEYSACESAAVSAHKMLGCDGISRTDLILSGDGQAYVLEVNTLPGLTELSLVPMIAGGKGISFNMLIESLIEDALAKKSKE